MLKLWLSCLLQSVVSAHAELTGSYYTRTNGHLGGAALTSWLGEHIAVITHSRGTAAGTLASQNGCTGTSCPGRLEQRSNSQVQGWMQAALMLCSPSTGPGRVWCFWSSWCMAGQLRHLLSVNSAHTWTHTATDSTELPQHGGDNLLPTSLAPHRGCVPCQCHVYPLQGGPRPSALVYSMGLSLWLG